MYHYLGAGLDNVYLKNGYHEVAYGNEIATSVVNVEGLHKEIATAVICRSNSRLSGKEIRFLRNEMKMPQSALADLIDIDVQTLANWEKGVHEVNGPADKLLKLYAGQQLLNSKSKIGKLLERFAVVNNHLAEKLCFAESDEVWLKAA